MTDDDNNEYLDYLDNDEEGNDDLSDDWDPDCEKGDPDYKVDDEEGNEEGDLSDEEAMFEDEEIQFSDTVLEAGARKALESGTRITRDYQDRLSEEFKLLMGQANLCVAKGDRKSAINICLEIIRNIPDSPAPYETLSVIFEEENDLYKSVQYGLISAHLWPKDPQKWYILAQKCTELKDKENEKTCMSKALRYSHLTRDRDFIESVISYFVKPLGTNTAQLTEETALKLHVGYSKLIKISTEKDKNEMAAMISLFEEKCGSDVKKSVYWAKSYQNMIRRYPDLITEEKVIKTAKICLAGKHTSRVVDLLVNMGYVKVDKRTLPGPSSEGLQQDVQDKISEIEDDVIKAAPEIPLEDTLSFSVTCAPLTRALLVAALVALHHEDQNTEDLLSPLLKSDDPSSVEEELILVADAYFDTERFDKALSIYDSLSKCELKRGSHVTVRLGLCLEQQDNWRGAVKCYEQVLQIDDSNTQAKLRLFELQQQHLSENQADFSVNIHADFSTIKDLSTRPDVVKLSYHRSNELITAGDYMGALEEGYEVLKKALFESIEYRCEPSKAHDVLRGTYVTSGAVTLLSHITSVKFEGCAGLCDSYRAMLSREEYWDWYLGLVSCCMAADSPNKAIVICMAVLGSRLIDTVKSSKDALIHGFYLASLLDHREFISEYIGNLMYQNPDHSGIWNLFFSVRHRLPRYRLTKIGVRWLLLNKGNFNGLFLNMQNTYSARNYKAAISLFRQMLGQRPRDATTYLYLSLFYLHYSCNKAAEHAGRRHQLVVQAVACSLLYLQLRGDCQEALYNVGRCYHHIGLFDLAIEYYKRALYSAPTVPKDVQSQVEKINKSLKKLHSQSEEAADVVLEDIDLTQEIVHNMSLIYQASGANHLARLLMYQHAVV